MVLASARPEVHELFPDAWNQRGVVELRLSELTPKAGEKLVREVLGDAGAGGHGAASGGGGRAATRSAWRS